MKNSFAVALITAFSSASTTEWTARHMRQKSSGHYDYMSPAAWGISDSIKALDLDSIGHKRSHFPSRKSSYHGRSSYGRPSYYGWKDPITAIFKKLDELRTDVDELKANGGSGGDGNEGGEDNSETVNQLVSDVSQLKIDLEAAEGDIDTLQTELDQAESEID